MRASGAAPPPPSVCACACLRARVCVRVGRRERAPYLPASPVSISRSSIVIRRPSSIPPPPPSPPPCAPYAAPHRHRTGTAPAPAPRQVDESCPRHGPREFAGQQEGQEHRVGEIGDANFQR
jgi:hypothetical protein